jgi:plasmid segregation protein ParM
MANKLIAIDPGYGEVKVFDGKKEFKFVNAISFAGNTSVDYNQNALNIFSFNDMEYLVGDQALINNPFITRNYDYLEEYVPLLVYQAFKLANIKSTDTIKLITGLSLKDWSKANDFGERLMNIYVNNEHYVIEPENIKIVPQGKGIYTDYKANNNSDEDYYAIVDIGYNTFDFLLFLNGKPVPNKNYANTLGVNTLVQEVQKITNKLFQVQFSEQEIREIVLKKAVRIGAKNHDLSHIIDKEILKYSKLLSNEILAKNGDLINKVFKIIISGGGAYLLEQLKSNLFDHQVFSNPPYEFANVRGYYRELVNEQ